MKKADNDRLLKALVISIVFHGLLFFGMNLFNWFPETNRIKKYSPLSVTISNISSPIPNNSSSDNKITETPSLPVPSPPSTPSASKPLSSARAVVTKDTASDPYADLGISSDSTNPPEQSDTREVVKEKAYVPANKNSIEFETPVTVDRKEASSSPGTVSGSNADEQRPIISETELSDLESAVGSGSARSENSSPSESDRALYSYNDLSVKFDAPGVQRQVLTNPPPKVPGRLPAKFPSEIHYYIRFSLNPDGLIKVLSITPSSVYPEIDASIRKALRSWTFNKSMSNEDIEGTITLIFKGR